MSLLDSNLNNTIIAIFLIALLFMVLYFGFRMVEMVYVMMCKKPLYNHVYINLKQLSISQQTILKNNFSFYDGLGQKQQQYFEHRVAKFMDDKTFVGRNGMLINDEVKVLVSATAVMLTFGFRDFYIGIIDKIVVYPNPFYSTTNNSYHKGEFNPKLKTLVLSWEDFKQGYNIGNDNLNLGIHEFAHAIHLNSIKERDVGSTIFRDSFNELTTMLSNNEPLRNKLVTSKYFREYAYTNQFEFLAVLIEYFFETPTEFKSQFPKIYVKVKQMLNFNDILY